MDPEREAHEAFKGVLRYYELAKRQEWQVRDLPWGDVPPIPEGKGSPERQARRRDMWRSVLTQQLQADMLACEMSSQLLNIAPDPEAKLYYSTMVQDESRHTEAWLKLVEAANRLLPTFVQHALWRPKERSFIGSAMRERDIENLKKDLEIGVRLAESLGLDVSEVELPVS